MKASDLFVKALEAEGVEYIFGIPGEENLDLLNSLKDSHIKLIVTRHEQAAGFMAATYGRLTGHAGVCLSTLGPGATNLVTAAAYANLGAMPMVMITGQKPIKSSKQGQFQIIDVVDMMHPITKYACQITSGHNIPARIREAFRIAKTERPGAVHLELPEDIADEETNSQVIEQSAHRRPLAEDKGVATAVKMIEDAKHPLILIGAAANRKTAGKMIRQLIDQTGIPFFTTQMGKGVVDERHHLYLGCAALSDHDFVNAALKRADLIVNIGHDVVEKPPFFMKQDGFKVIHVNFTNASVDPVYFPQADVVGDIANSVYQIKTKLQNQSHWKFGCFMEVKVHIDRNLAEGTQDNRFPVYPQRLVSDIRKVVPETGVIALDNGVYKIWFARNFLAYHHNTVLLDNALATMGAGLPSAIAAKLVTPEAKVMAICGDGGFMMNSQELETAVRLKLDLVVLILNDNAFGMIRWKQANMGFEDFGLKLNNPDFVLYAQSYGAYGHRVSSADDVIPTVEKCYAQGGVHVIEVPIDYSDNDRILNHEIREQSDALNEILSKAEERSIHA
ncbi:acetolactate synthase large subunit [Thiomicrorhabdus arctica]|uniref:acetolactate synthase large subunit n=1 Tax=Thiomicrorhabdus arctica TaxID=131540 RepID=UPI0003643946|nr:acetolactate synthase large subunit [Thiomicrorhabdus arctica]